MSGIAGVFCRDGAPVDQRTIEGMVEAVRFRGPDAERVWIGGSIGLAFTLLATDEVSHYQEQPRTLDGAIFVVADIRLDARADFAAALAAEGREIALSANDADLLLHAYLAWGQDCVNHMLGDFAFAIWDGRARTLFCARDQLGAKPLYYADKNHAFAFSNTLRSVRRHPNVTPRLNDLAVADFLMFGYNEEPDTTTFADIKRLPPAHFMLVSADGVAVRRYWTLPVDEPIYYKRKDDYAERFRDLVQHAVADRTRTEHVGIFLSGGLDSPTMAAAACALSREGAMPREIRAFTVVDADPVGEAERHYAGLVARHLAIPIEFRERAVERLELPRGLDLPEPSASPFEAIAQRGFYRRVASKVRVALHGEGPDNALVNEWRAYLAYLLGRHAWSRMGQDIVLHAMAHRRVPLLTSVPRMFKSRAEHARLCDQLPAWLNKSLVSRLELKERWRQWQRGAAPVHPIRPRAFNSFRSAFWQSFFESCDAEALGAPLDIRHPLADLRLLRFMLAVPTLPWCRNKYLVRYAMRDRLPRATLCRPKSPLATHPLYERTRQTPLPDWTPSKSLCDYVDVASVSRLAASGPHELGESLRVAGLSLWLEGTANTECR